MAFHLNQKYPKEALLIFIFFYEKSHLTQLYTVIFIKIVPDELYQIKKDFL